MLTYLAIAFVGGLISCASTCFLPLVPAYISYMGGRAVAVAGEPVRRQQLQVLKNAALFVAGFATVFVLLGTAVGLLGADLRPYRPLMLRVGGVLLIIMGIALLGGLPWLMRQFRFEVAHRLPRGPWSSYVVGLAFAVGWTPCVGPILTAILIIAANSGTAAQGALLLAAYSLGMGIPLLLAAGLIGQASRLVRRLSGASRAINIIAAVSMIAMGVLIFSNRLTVLNSYFPYFSLTPPFQSSLKAAAVVPQYRVPTGNGLIEPGRAAPPLIVSDLQGNRVNLSDLRGKPVLINFWATWCSSCREELPMIFSAYRAHQAEGLTILAIDYQESPDVVRKFWSELHLDGQPFLDPAGSAAAGYGVGLRDTGLPVTVFVARNGTVSAYAPFALDPDYLSAQLKPIL